MSSKILVVDDSIEYITLLTKYLKDEGYEIIFAKNGEKALEIISNQKIELILLDIEMPVMDGYETAKHLKNPLNETEYEGYEKYSHIPIIFLTANNESENISKGFELGAADYITKPFNKKELLARVGTQLKLAQALNQNILLLSQYKKAVDESTLVSKTNTKGIITYANQEFIDISGYTESELIGQPHNIVRDPDMPQHLFEDMWRTIRNKKIWKGNVSNRKKNGEIYYVHSTVIPILDMHGELVEFMSIRYDITETYKLQQEIEATQKEVVFTMGAIGETRSQETGNHVKRVAEYSRVLAKAYGLDDEHVELIVQASPMHDIGKVGIPDSILNKPAKLTKEEFDVMRTHAELGYSMLKHSTRPILQTAAKIAFEHHEHWNGHGYPRYLTGEEISIEGRITAIADVFDALGSDRCYKLAWEDEEIFAMLKEQRAKQFDPQLIDLFFENLDEILSIREGLKDV